MYITDPRDDKARIEETKGGLLRDAYRWVIDHPDFRQWRNGDSRSLWIKGDPGKGKTMLLCGIVDELHDPEPSENLRRTTDHSPVSEPTSLAFFFCQATDNRLNGASQVLRGLIFHLAVQRPVLVKHIRARWDVAPRNSLFEGPSAWFALADVLTNMLHDPDTPRTILVIDALDECVGDLPRLLGFITKISPPRVKWLVSSRNTADVEEELEEAQKLALCLELNSDSISSAVRTYVSDQVERLARKKQFDTYDSSLRHEVKRFLTEHSENTFLWVSLVCQNLARVKVRVWDIRNALNSEHLPTGLTTLYDRMIHQMNADEDADICNHILRLVCTAYRPVTLQEMGSLLEVPDKFSGLGSSGWLNDVVQLCGSFLVIRDETVYLVHQSARDFLTKDRSGEIFPSGVSEEHCAIFERSMKLLGRTLEKNIYNLQHEGGESGSAEVPTPDPLAAARYSCVYWVEHLNQSMQADDMTRAWEGLQTLLEEKFLNWLEALSLLNNYPHGIGSMTALDVQLRVRMVLSPLATRKAKQRIQSTNAPKKLRNLVHDAVRFMRYFKNGIETSPLQVYSSALVFSPTNSLVRQTYEHESPTWIVKKSIVTPDWDACLFMLEGHQDDINCMGFGQNGLFASASDDRVIKIWNTFTGTCLHTLKDDTPRIVTLRYRPLFIALTFRADNKLVSASSDGRLAFWDVTEGKLLEVIDTFPGANFEESDIYFHKATFGPQDQVAFCFSTNQGNYIGVFDTSTRSWGVSFPGVSPFFGPDGRVSFAQHKDIRGSEQWWLGMSDLTSPNFDLLPVNNKIHIVTIAFGPKNQCALLTPGCVIYLINALTCECIKTFSVERGGCPPDPITFSADGLRLVYSSGIGLYIWDIQTGARLGGIFGRRMASRFCADSTGRTVATCSNPHLVHMWDFSVPTKNTTYSHSPDTYIRHFNGLAINPNGREIALAWFHGKHLAFLDVTTDAILRKLSIESDYLHWEAVSYTRQGTKLAWNEEGLPSSIVVLDVTTDERLTLPLGFHANMDSCFCGVYITFSPDGKTLAFLRNEHLEMTSRLPYRPPSATIAQVWDLSAVRCLWLTEVLLPETSVGHCSVDYDRLVFSTDGSRLAAIGFDKRDTKTWDAKTGRDCTNERCGGANDADKWRSHDGPVYGFSEDRSCIMRDGRPLLWIPPDFRPFMGQASSVRDIAYGGNTVAWQGANENLYYIEFAPEEPMQNTTD